MCLTTRGELGTSSYVLCSIHVSEGRTDGADQQEKTLNVSEETDLHRAI